MPNGPTNPLRLATYLLLALAAAQQQQPLLHGYRNSPQENSALRPLTPSPPGDASLNLNPDDYNGKATTPQTSDNKRAVATYAPAGPDPAVRDPPVRSAAARQSRARSLQDWEVENFVLLATVDGSIYARDRNNGKELWKFHSERPMVETIYHRRKDPATIVATEDDYMWIVEPSQDGTLYIFTPGPEVQLQKLGLTVKQLADELSPYCSEDSRFVYTAEKKNTLFTLNATNGVAIKFFSAGRAGIMDSASCRPVNELEMEEEECEPTPTLILGRNEYVVGIQDRETGENVCTLKYFEWTPNNRDRDLQAQYMATMDNKYIYSRYDGSIMSLEHGPDFVPGSKFLRDQLVYHQKSKSPVVRVFDVARPQDTDARDTPLVLLPQPISPAFKYDTSREVFINRTEAGSWYAMSQLSYPFVTDGADQAKCYKRRSPFDADWEDDELVGVHYIAGIDDGDDYAPAIGGPLPFITYQNLRNDTTLDNTEKPKRKLLRVAETLFSPYNFAIFLLLTLLTYQYKDQLLKAINSSPAVKHPIAIRDPFLEPSPPPSSEDLAATSAEVVPLETIESKSATIDSTDRTLLEKQTSEDIQPLGDTILGVDGAADADGAAEGQKKKKRTHRGQRGGRKRRPKGDKNEKEEADDEVERIVEDMTKLRQVRTMQPEEQVTFIVDDIDEISGNIELNNLVVYSKRPLGYGSGGTIVYEGTFEGREVAVKRMLLQYFDLASQEVSLLQQSDDHPNVIRYFCHQKGRDFLYIAVERCQASLWDLYREGGTLDTLNHDQLKLLTAINSNVPGALYQLAAGLSHLHGLRIIHRDIKPQNILIAYPKPNQKSLRFVISDFGLCRTLPENVSTLAGTIGNAGTIGWKAPELIGQPRDSEGRQSTTDNNANSSSHSTNNGSAGSSQGVKRAVDIFSLGCVFFYVLTNGGHPFDNKEESEVWHVERELNIKRGLLNISKLSRLGDDAQEPTHLIRWMLRPKPELRPTATQVMNHPFFWSVAKRLSFLCDVSDHFEREPRDPPSAALEKLEEYSEEVITNGDFLRRLDRKFVDTLGRQRKYTGDRMLDLLRALRNKKNHYADMPEDVQHRVGVLPEGYLRYWTSKFPGLLMACWEVVMDLGLEDEPRFRGYVSESGTM